MSRSKNESIYNSAFGWLTKSSEDIKTFLGKTHDDKRRIIVNADDMTTREKLEALDNNDYQLIWKWAIGGTLVVYLVSNVGSGKSVDLERIGTIGRKLLS